jgi:hypothetical protein
MARSFTRTNNDYLHISSAVLTSTPITMACWYKVTDITNFHCLMSLTNYVGGASGHFHMLAARGDVAGDKLEATSYSGASSAALSDIAYTANVWQHGCAVFASATDRRVYLDGGNKGTNATSRNPTSLGFTSIAMLRRDGYLQGPVDGLIAEAGMWNVALTDDEVAILAKGVSPQLVRPGNLVAYWPLIGRYSPEIDLVGGYNLTVDGAVVENHPRILYPSIQNLGMAFIPPGIPEAPTDLSAEAITSTRIDLAWTDNATDETGFSIERSTDGVNYDEIDTVAANAVSYQDVTVLGNTKYYYRVRAFNITGYSLYSNVAEETTPAGDVGFQRYLVWDSGALDGQGSIRQTDLRYLGLADGVPEPDTLLGITWIYIDRDDGNLKVKFGDGTIKTIATNP